MVSTDAPSARRLAYERATSIPMTVLAVLFLATYSWRVLDTGASPRVDFLLTAFDVLIWLLFATDFAVRCWLSTHRWHFVRTHPIELLIALLPPLRPLRLMRAAMVVLDTLNRHTFSRMRLSVFVGTSSALVIYLCSLAMFDAEYGVEGAKVQNFGDALWWASVSVTTVGYGDYYPVTVEGRLIALVLMFFGIGLISFAIGTATSWVVDQLKSVEESADRADREIGALAEELRALRAEVAALRTGSETESPGVGGGGEIANEQSRVQ
ncbi:potassium channel family protein [Nocardia sp. NPDC050406]|uniref:potassium channel family protein n=1 Tax=Nocardia sp. NPDC050406 TaxID=3364318 RepID=UPI0037BDCEB9